MVIQSWMLRTQSKVINKEDTGIFDLPDSLYSYMQSVNYTLATGTCCLQTINEVLSRFVYLYLIVTSSILAALRSIIN